MKKLLNIKVTPTNVVFAIVALLAFCALIWNWYHPNTEIQEKIVRVEVPKNIVKIKRVEVPVERVIVIEKEKVVKEIALPETIKVDDSKQVATVGEIREHEAPTDVAAVIDTETGVIELVANPRRRSLFQILNEKSLGVGGWLSYTDSLKKIGDVHGSWAFFRVGAFHLIIAAELNTLPEARAGLKVDYKW